MKSTRRLLSIILCLIMCLSLLPTAAFADDGLIASGDANPGDPGKVSFKLYKSGKLVIGGYGTVDDMEHWSFGFYGSYSSAEDAKKATRSETRTLEVGEGITELDSYAFTECANLTSVSLPSSLITIGYGAFDDCQRLTKITIPGNVTKIGNKAFHDCVNLTSVTLSTGLQTIGENAFDNCAKLASITIPANVKEIGKEAFANCGSLKEITFLGNFDSTGAQGVKIAADAFKGVTATVYYPVDNNSWNSVLDPMSTYNDFGGRLTWTPRTASSSASGWVVKNGDWYYYVGGKMLVNAWKAYSGEWFYFGKDGKMLQGRQQIDGDYYYFGVDGTDAKVGARLSGMHDGEFYGEDGKWQPSYLGVDDSGLDFYKNGWQQVNGKWFYIRNKAKVTGWLYSRNYWYYLDPTTGAMVTGWLTVNGKTYYLRPLDKAIADGIPDREGAMVAGRSYDVGGVIYTFDKNGALQGGKMEENPMGLQNGFRQEGPSWYFYRSDGKKATGWELVNNSWYYFDGNGKMLTGWQKVKGEWYYMTPATGSGKPTDSATGKMVTGFQTIPVTPGGVNSTRTYFFKGSGALNGKGWIKVGLKWYFLEQDGVVATGWLRDGSKWYYLRDDTSPIGEMVTGVFDVPATLASGKTNSPSGKQSFKANGEWTGAGDKTASGGAVKAGEWRVHDGGWYYHDANGAAVTGWHQIDGKWYYLNPSSSPAGKMVTGWQTIDGNRFYFESSGAMLAGWQNIEGVWYYLNPNHDGTYGKLMTGWQQIKGDWYYLDDATGAVQDGWYEVKAGSKGEAQGFAKGWYYLNPEHDGKYGAMQKGGWKEINGKWYFFHNQYDGSYGKLEQGKWIETNGKWYYVQASSDPTESWMVTGWVVVDGHWFYFGGDGAARGGWQQIDGKWYYFHNSHDGHFGEMYTNTTVDGYTIDANGVANR